MVKALLLDLNQLVKEGKDTSLCYRENIRNVYGVYIDTVSASSFVGTVQEDLYRRLKDLGLEKRDVDEKMEQYINELPYAYYNVAGHNSMGFADGAQAVLDYFGGNKEFVVGLATPVLEKIAQNMFERIGTDASVFKVCEYGGFGKDANTLLVSAVDLVREMGVDGAGQSIFVSGSPEMLKNAKLIGMKTVGIFGYVDEDDIKDANPDTIIKSMKDLKKAVSKFP